MPDFALPSCVTLLLFFQLYAIANGSWGTRSCNPSCFKLSSKEVWRREEGWWIGNYTVLGRDGKPYRTPSWPYGYAAYHGFVRIVLDGPCLTQRNVFLYPPQNPAECTGPGNVVGTGKCGVNGNERVFNTDQIAADCSGNVAGSFRFGNSSFDTKTTVALGGSDTLLYQLRSSQNAPNAAGELFGNRLSTLGADGTRVLSTHALIPGTGTALALSYFREERVSEDVWRKRLAEVRAQFNVLASDYCGWDIALLRPNKTCAEHFTFPKCKFSVTRRVCRWSRRLW